MEPISFYSVIRFDGRLRMASATSVGVHISVARELFFSLYEVEISNPAIPKLAACIKVPLNAVSPNIRTNRLQNLNFPKTFAGFRPDLRKHRGSQSTCLCILTELGVMRRLTTRVIRRSPSYRHRPVSKLQARHRAPRLLEYPQDIFKSNLAQSYNPSQVN